jgi:lipopolysaccharide transport system permease protein
MFRAAGQIFRFRSLLGTLTVRELKARYRGSVLGFVWSLANPLLLLAVYTFVFTVVFKPRVAGADPYALFVVSGLFPWIWLSTSTLEGASSLSANAGLIRKSVFPAELLPMVVVAANLVHLLLALLVAGGAVAVAAVAGRLPLAHPAAFLLTPLVILLELPLVAGIALGSSALTVHFRDLRDLLINAMALLFFLTPVLYPLASLDGFRRLQLLIRLNPFTPFTLAYQETLFYGRVPGLLLWLEMAGVGLVAWLLGSALFERLRETLVEAA